MDTNKVILGAILGTLVLAAFVKETLDGKVVAVSPRPAQEAPVAQSVSTREAVQERPPEYRAVFADPERLEYQTNKVFQLKHEWGTFKYRGLHMVSHVETDDSTTLIVCGEYDFYDGRMGFTRFMLDTKYGDAHMNIDNRYDVKKHPKLKALQDAYDAEYDRVCN